MSKNLGNETINLVSSESEPEAVASQQPRPSEPAELDITDDELEINATTSKIRRLFKRYKVKANRPPMSDSDECGEEKEILRLRVKYNSAILSSQINEDRDTILEEASKCYTIAAENNLLNFIVENSAKYKALLAEVASLQNEKQGALKKRKTITFAANLTTFDKQANE